MITELFPELTARQCEVAEGFLTGKMTTQIAYEMRLADRTVEQHRQNICKALRCSAYEVNIALAARVAIFYASQFYQLGRLFNV